MAAFCARPVKWPHHWLRDRFIALSPNRTSDGLRVCVFFRAGCVGFEYETDYVCFVEFTLEVVRIETMMDSRIQSSPFEILIEILYMR